MAQLQAQVAGVPGQPGAGLMAETAAARADLEATKQRVSDLESTLRNLNSSMEGLTAELAQARRDLAAAAGENGQLRQRVAQMESAQAAAAAAAAAQPMSDRSTTVLQPAEAAAPAPLPEEPQALLAEARRLAQAGRHSEAQAAYTAFLARHSARSEAAEARYRLGEALYAQEDHADAAQAYIAALRGWPKTEWAPDAVVKLSSTLVALKQPAEACRSLAELDRRYGSAPAAVKARAQQVKTAAKCK